MDHWKVFFLPVTKKTLSRHLNTCCKPLSVSYQLTFETVFAYQELENNGKHQLGFTQWCPDLLMRMSANGKV